MGSTKCRQVQRGRFETKIAHTRSQVLLHAFGVAPLERRRRRGPGRGRQIAEREPHEPRRQCIWSPGGEGDAARRLQHPQHLASGRLGLKTEHVRVLAEDDVEAGVWERQALRRAFEPLDVAAAGERHVFIRLREECGRRIDSCRMRPLLRRDDRDQARAGTDVEHAIARLDTRKPDQSCRFRGAAVRGESVVIADAPYVLNGRRTW
jgi:hypothetical protein